MEHCSVGFHVKPNMLQALEVAHGCVVGVPSVSPSCQAERTNVS